MDMARPADPGLHTGWVSSGGAGAGGFGEKRRGWPALDEVPQTDRPLKVPRGLLGRPEDLGSGAHGGPPDALGCPGRMVALLTPWAAPQDSSWSDQSSPGLRVHKSQPRSPTCVRADSTEPRNGRRLGS